jgi:hypothetical protein
MTPSMLILKWVAMRSELAAAHKHGIERHTGRADSRPGGGVAGTISDVVFTLVSGHPGFEEGVEEDQANEHQKCNGRNQHAPRPGVAKPHRLPAWWNQAQAPSAKPMYQSGCVPAPTGEGS